MILPKTRSSEKRHRKRKRELEIRLIVESMNTVVRGAHTAKSDRVRILEFGSGNGFQIPYMEQIGDVVASDVYVSDEVRSMKDARFVECSITDAPFRRGHFDIIFSNHVLEHIEDTDAAFDELKRIGTQDCIYAFSVPTHLWLLLTLPAQYYNKLRRIRERRGSSPPLRGTGNPGEESGECSTERGTTFFRKALPSGHGVHSTFFRCYRSLQTKNWQRLFSQAGFAVVKVQPLLLYGPSEWPLIPTTSVLNRFRICSSALFLLRKRGG